MGFAAADKMVWMVLAALYIRPAILIDTSSTAHRGRIVGQKSIAGCFKGKE
jgi:hypothetical protein